MHNAESAKTAAGFSLAAALRYFHCESSASTVKYNNRPFLAPHGATETDAKKFPCTVSFHLWWGAFGAWEFNWKNQKRFLMPENSLPRRPVEVVFVAGTDSTGKSSLKLVTIALFILL